MKISRFVIVVGVLGLLAGCATAPNGGASDANDAMLNLAVQSATLVAVDRVVTHNNATPADIEARATRIVNVASGLKALGADKLSTLPMIRAALAPLVDQLNLTTMERAQADLLVQTLVAVALERVKADAAFGAYATQVNFVLDEVIKDASVYIPAAPEPASL